MAPRGDRPLHQKLAWFALLWLAGIAAVGAAAWIIRLLLGL
jgi:hypothetical protein